MAHIKHTHEEKMAKAKRICDVYAEGENDIESCCDSEGNGLTYRQFKNWVNEISEISDLYKAARVKSDATKKGEIRNLAIGSLKKGVTGHDDTETTTEYRNIKKVETFINADGKEEKRDVWTPIKIKEVVKKIRIQPNPTLIMYALNNSNVIEDATFNHASKVDVTTLGESIAPTNPLSVLSTDLLEQIEAQLKEKEENE